ncbi:MAG: hypothetical protein E7443_01985 [Ruminococcaceae bacterium]|nr:hypothetical protein [Oscillospiraceae bacterium]
MKKLIALALTLTCVLGLIGCNKSMHNVSENESSASGTMEEDITSFSAKVLEVNDSYLLVEPLADSNESKSADKIEVPLKGKTSWPIPAVGDMVNVFYSGEIQETYPARITKVHRVEIETSNPNTEPDSEIPGRTRFIVEIRDRAKEENLPCDAAIEKFYEDETTEYYFNVIKSPYIIVTYNNGNSEDIVTALNEGRATIADLDRFSIQYWSEPKEDDLDIAISKAILDHYRSDVPDGLIHVESHVLLANEVISGTPQVGADNHTEKTMVYLLVHYVKYSTYGGTLEAVGGSYVPAAITFKIGGSGEYILEEYWEPRDGSYYTDDIRSKFPGASADDALNDQAYIEDLKAQTYNKALAYLNSTISLDSRIAELLDEIQSSPAYSSKPGDYIEVHEPAYEELLGYGKYTLQYCFAVFLQGGQTDLQGHIMASACQDIMLAWGEGYTIDYAPATGQVWFEAFCGNAESLSKQFRLEELEKNFPGAFLLLQMSNNEFEIKDEH